MPPSATPAERNHLHDDQDILSLLLRKTRAAASSPRQMPFPIRRRQQYIPVSQLAVLLIIAGLLHTQMLFAHRRVLRDADILGQREGEELSAVLPVATPAQRNGSTLALPSYGHQSHKINATTTTTTYHVRQQPVKQKEILSADTVKKKKATANDLLSVLPVHRNVSNLVLPSYRHHQNNRRKNATTTSSETTTHHVRQRPVKKKNIPSDDKEKEATNKKKAEIKETAEVSKPSAKITSEEDFTTTASALASGALFETDELCGGCRYLQSGRTHCGELFEKLAKEQNTTLIKAAQHALDSKAAPKDCRPCVECQDHHRRYWRPDQAAPTVQKATTHYLTTIPEETHRVPREILATEGHETITQYFKQEPNRYPAKRYLFEYNPSIVPMPINDYQKKLNVGGVAPTYVASYRVGTQQACFPTNTTLQMIGGSWKTRPPSVSYLGIALLDKDLSILADAVVDLPKNFLWREDFRFFVLKKRLYLSSYAKLTPLHIGTKKQPPYTHSDETQPVLKVFPSPLQVTVGRKPLFISNDSETKRQAKNLNYFVDLETQQTIVEINPTGDLMSKSFPRQTQPVDLTMPTKDNPHQLYGKANVTTTDLEKSSRPSFYTVDELALARYQNFYESPYVADRGSACCVEFEQPNENDNRKLLLGISHVKIPWGRKKMEEAGLIPNQYLSRFYAMKPTAPYRTVAMSGYICLGPDPSAAQVNDNPLAARTPHHWFTIGELTLNCPAIHFVTGMTEKVDDPSTLIIAYGVADCTSWFVEVSKQQVVDMLFGPPKVDSEQSSSQSIKRR